MSINYGDSGLIINYIQMFLKEYYSKFLNIEYEYSREMRDNIINYINSPDSIEMTEMLINVLPEFKDPPYGYKDLIENFNRESRIDKIYFESKLAHAEQATKNNDFAYYMYKSVQWLDKSLRNFNSYIYKYGWRVSDFNYNNKNNKCDITIAKINKNILPKSALMDLINLCDKKYTETCFAKDVDGNKYFSSMYNFEIENYNHKLTKGNENNLYELIIPTIDTEYIAERKGDGIYEVEIGDSTIKNFRGFKTFTSNIYINSNGEKQRYIIYLKKPDLSSLNLDKNISFVYLNLSNTIGKTVTITSNDNLEELKETELNVIDISDEDYSILYFELPDNISEDYKLCLSIYDPNNEIDTILSFKLDNNYINEEYISYYNKVSKILSYNELCSTTSKKAISNVLFVTPSDYYNNPYVLHEKFISYILEQIVHNYSREEDIILIQKFANKIGFSYDNYNFGEYGDLDNDSLKQFIFDIQNKYSTREGKPILYGKGYTDPDTESIINLQVEGR